MEFGACQKSNLVTKWFVRCRAWDETQCAEVVNAAYRVWERTGCVVQNEKVRELLKDVGCPVNGDRVGIPRWFME